MANGTIAFDTLSTSGQISGTAKSVDTDYLAYGSAKCWAHLDLNTENTIDDSLNTASITDNATGKFTLTMTNNMSSINYITAGHASVDAGGSNYNTGITPIAALLTTAMGFAVSNLSNVELQDAQDVMPILFGDLA